jgi:hypothetical protein
MKYWNNQGRYQAVYEALHKLIPAEGACPADKPALEKLRVAGNCYYDLYNNGLCNRASEFRRVFGFGGTSIAKGGYKDEAKMALIDAKIDKLIILAARENNIEVPS